MIQRFEPQEWTKAVEPSTAADLTAMMELAVQSGTGVAAQIPGISVAGKTGTAETGVAGRNNTWFIAFAPARPPGGRRRGRPLRSGGHRRRDGGPDRARHHRGGPQEKCLTSRDSGHVGSDSLINSLFDGRYRILRKLGFGGMANVYLAEDEELPGRRVAIKILNERYAGDDLFIERFRREAKSAAGLSHPNIVSIYDRGEAEGTYYIAMEVIEGRSLKELIMTRGAPRFEAAIGYEKQLLEALASRTGTGSSTATSSRTTCSSRPTSR